VYPSLITPSKQEITRSPPKAIQTTQDVGYYALSGLNLSKLYVPCTFEFLILAIPYLQLTTSAVSLGGLDGKTPTSLDMLKFVKANKFSLSFWWRMLKDRRKWL
jgi:hypothetical protein